MFTEFRKINPDRIVFTGDLVHSKNQLSPELVEMVIWTLSESSKIAKTILISGNHDFLNSNLERLDTLSPIISALNNDNIVYYKDRGVYEDENVSWCVYSQFQGNVPPDIKDAKGFKIGLFHDPIQGLKTDLGFDFGEHAYDIEKFDGLDIVLCGDIHKRATFKIPNGKLGVMIGSTIQQNFGESVKNHGFGVFNIPNYKYEFVDIDNPRPFLSFKINGIKDIENGTEKLVNLG
jgi:DNA repair exonuclease SbcCD nuclease subunit